MASDSAPTQTEQQGKRVRFEEANSTSPKLKKAQPTSPKTAATSTLSSFSEALQHDLGSIFLNLGKQWIDIIAKYRSKTNQLMKMANDEEFIPRSARIEFEFYVSKPVENSDEFTTIKGDTDALIINFRKALKSQIMKVMRLEISNLEKEANDFFVNAVATVARATLIHSHSPVSNLHTIVSTIMESHHDSILDETGMTYEQFCELYKNNNSLQQFPLPIAVDDDNLGEEALLLATQRRTAESVPTRINLIATLVTPIITLLSREKEIEAVVSLKKLLHIDQQEKANSDTQARMDVEHSIDHQLVNELIVKTTAESTKNLRSEIGQLKKQLNDLNGGKNERRGPKGGASSTKNKTTKKQRRNKRGDNSRRSASPSRPPPRKKSNNNNAQRADKQGRDTQQRRSKGRKSQGRRKK